MPGGSCGNSLRHIGFTVAACLIVMGVRGEEAPWVKLKTSEYPLRNERQILSPGLLDRDLQHVISFPIDGRMVPLGLPHAGKDAEGKARPELKGACRQGFLWVDLDGDGRRGNGEVRKAKPGSSVGPFVYRASYDDGTEGSYAFVLNHTAKPGRYALVRCTARQVRVGSSQLVILDENGNGRYDDIGKDALLVDREPITFLGRQVLLGGELREIIIHPAGQIIEVRPVRNARLARLNMFLLHRPPRKLQGLRIRTVIVSGTKGSFSFDRTHPERMVPVGAYDMAFGLFERGKERVILKSGELTSFRVEGDRVNSPCWGGHITGNFKIESDGREITVHPPVFVGQATEVYRPVEWGAPLAAHKRLLWRGKCVDNVAQYRPQQVERFRILPGGVPAPVTFQHFRDGDIQIKIRYASGILGSVTLTQQLAFVARKP